ncbi:recombinase family protein [Schlesneria sp. T3-172]|uniref:recombinase family protein n=1 Tax=Schlesneria sphaerica TaxID=3373610 RepID=UPI0037C5F2AB
MAVVNVGNASSCGKETVTTPPRSKSALSEISPIVISRLGARRRKSNRNNGEGIVVCYARYSSNQQDEKSITDQARSCRAHAADKHMRIDDDAIYKDEAVSGTLLHREGLDRLLADAASGKIQVIYFYNLSRLARESVITKTLMRQLVDLHRIRVICVVENIDSDVNGWNTIASIFSLVHEEFLNILLENVRNGQIGTVEKGFSVGDWRFGYTSVPSPNGETIRRAGNEVARRIYQINEDQAYWVRQVFHWFVIEFRSIQWIVRKLNEQRVPKDHRSTTAKWSHQLVVNMLRCPKYVGIWPWGQRENIRDPATGRVTQVERAESKCEKWTRHRDDLQIIDNDLFIEAQEQLDENARQMEAYRDAKGRLRGSDGSHNRVQLLTGLMECPSCGNKFHVTGSHGDYLQCCGARDGDCDCKTMLPRRVAERLILNEISQRLLNNSEWRDAVVQRAEEIWQELRHQNPTSVDDLRKRLQSLDCRVQRLLDQVESEDQPDPDITLRLQDRRRERAEATRELERVQAQALEMPTPPSDEWVTAQLQELHVMLQGDVEAANRALLRLLGKSMRLELIEEEGRKRKFWRGIFRIQSLEFSKLSVTLQADEADTSANPEIVLNFRVLPLEETQVLRAWEMLQKGHSFTEIANELNVKKARVSGIMKIVARRFGSGCSAKELKAKFCDQRPPSEPYKQFIEPAMELYNEGWLYEAGPALTRR